MVSKKNNGGKFPCKYRFLCVLAIVILGALIWFSVSQMAYEYGTVTVNEIECYQESATETTECGGLDTGAYSSVDASNDGDWDTSASPNTLTTYAIPDNDWEVVKITSKRGAEAEVEEFYLPEYCYGGFDNNAFGTIRWANTNTCKSWDWGNNYNMYATVMSTPQYEEAVTWIKYNYSGDVCYQESADVSEECGAVGNGSYTGTDYGKTTWHDKYGGDGDWWVNYTVPENTADAVWKVKNSYYQGNNYITENQIKHIHLPDSCVNENVSIWKDFVSNTEAYFYCQNADDSWELILDTGVGRTHGEAMIWGFAPQIIYGSSSGGGGSSYHTFEEEEPVVVEFEEIELEQTAIQKFSSAVKSTPSKIMNFFNGIWSWVVGWF